MKNSRFYTGLLLLSSPLFVLLLASFVRWLVPGVSVEGRIVYHGHPLGGGTICFASMDRERSGDMVAEIDADGRFACRPRWSQADTSGTRYQIFFYPDPRKPRRIEESEVVPASPPATDAAETQSPRVQPRKPFSRFAIASVPPSTPVAIQSVQPGASTEGRARPIEVLLGSGQAHVDINLGG